MNTTARILSVAAVAAFTAFGAHADEADASQFATQFETNRTRAEVQAELERILNFWMHKAVDNENGGFYGRIDHHNIVQKEAPKGSVLNSRILWSFSAAYRQTGNEVYLQLADRAYRYITNHFIDTEMGGVYWTVDYKGAPLDTKKQIYALSFAIYGASHPRYQDAVRAARPDERR